MNGCVCRTSIHQELRRMWSITPRIRPPQQPHTRTKGRPRPQKPPTPPAPPPRTRPPRPNPPNRPVCRPCAKNECASAHDGIVIMDRSGPTLTHAQPHIQIHTHDVHRASGTRGTGSERGPPAPASAPGNRRAGPSARSCSPRGSSARLWGGGLYTCVCVGGGVGARDDRWVGGSADRSCLFPRPTNFTMEPDDPPLW